MRIKEIALGLTLVLSVIGVAGVQASGQNSNGGTVVAWGRNGYGESNVPADLAGVVQVACGVYHSLALRSNGTLVSWGYNYWGQCNVPPGLAGVIQVAAGHRHSLALKSDGTVVAWGDNGNGQCSVPAGLAGVIQVAAGWQHSLALKSNGTVVAWGYNGGGQCNVPTGLMSAVQVAGGWAHSLARKSDGTVVAWGYNGNRQCNVPAGLAGVIQVAAGYYYSLALKSDGTVAGWGSDVSGLRYYVPVGLAEVIQVAAGWQHTMALKSDGAVVAWGYNDFGQSNVPAGLAGVTQVAAGLGHSLALVVTNNQVLVDIKPGSFPNNINPGSKGVIAVAILTTGTFDATAIDPLSVEFGPSKAKETHGKGHLEDANGDGKTDMVLHFRTEETGIQCGATQVALSGRTLTGKSITGTDSIVTVGCGSGKGTVEGDVPLALGLEQNYPNPFNPATTIRYAVPADANVSLAVYDMLGQKVAQLVEERMSAGYHDVVFDASQIGSGIYVYKLQAGSFVQMKKMLLVK